MEARTILHVDMDAFYAAIEVVDRPELRGRPVIVGGTAEGHGVVSTANYEARRHGVHSALPIVRALRLCPHGVFLPVRMDRYREVSRQVMAILGQYTPLLEQISIDEAFLDVSGSLRMAGSARHIAAEIGDRIRDATRGLTASIGIASNKFLAKVASDLEKPGGLVLVPPDGILGFLAPLPVERLWGVGPKTARRLHALNYRRIADLQSQTRPTLVASFGPELGEHLYRLSRGLDRRAVEPSRDAKSVSAETTLSQFLAAGETDAIDSLLLSLSERVATRMRHDGVWGRTLTIKVRDDRFHTCTRSLKLPTPVRATDMIYATARRLYRERIDLGEHRLRLLGVGLSDLITERPVQLDMFQAQSDRESRIADAVDAIREKMGPASITRGKLMRQHGEPP